MDDNGYNNLTLIKCKGNNVNSYLSKKNNCKPLRMYSYNHMYYCF